MIAGPIVSRLGPRSLAANDACFKLDRIHQSELVERAGLWVSRRLTVFSSRVARGHITAVQSRKISWRITPLW
jgi:hypothetical protein